MNWRTCGFKWESGNKFHNCEHAVKHTSPHRCENCGEELNVGASWEIGSSIDHATGKPKRPAPAASKPEAAAKGEK